MEDLVRMVADSLARHGYDAPVDHRRLEWSHWFRCESGLSLLLVPSSPGIYALGEEVAAPAASASSRRMLAVFEIADANDLSLALSRLFAPGHPLRDRLATGRCFARFARVSDPDQRHAASSALRQWLASSMEVATGFAAVPALQPEPTPGDDSDTLGEGGRPPSTREVLSRGRSSPPQAGTSGANTRRSPPPLPAGF